MQTLGCLILLLFFLLLVLLPVAFGQVFAAALLKLRLDPMTAMMVIIAMIVGGGINIPVKRIVRAEPLAVDPLAIFGLPGRWPRLQRFRPETVIAVNVGGCLVPVSLALYEMAYLLAETAPPVVGLGLGILANVAICYWLARPIKKIGIALPGLVPPAVAALCALAFAPEQAPPVAFIAGVLGPLIGADLLHLRDIAQIEAGMASIGGAGTFDGIVLSGIVAAYLA